MKFLGYIAIIGGLIIMTINGKPHSWGKSKSGKPVWLHLLIDLGGTLFMLLGLFLLSK